MTGTSNFIRIHITNNIQFVYRKAFTILQQRRFCINPNDGFMAQLREYEPIYQAQNTVSNGQQRSKRPIHMCDNDYNEPNEHIDAMDS